VLLATLSLSVRNFFESLQTLRYATFTARIGGGS
jgi:hypothetical protein